MWPEAAVIGGYESDAGRCLLCQPAVPILVEEDDVTVKK